MLANFYGAASVEIEHLIAGIPPAMYSVRLRELELSSLSLRGSH